MTPPEIVDSHCHLDFPDFDTTRDEVVARAIKAGVTRMVTICTRKRQLDQVRAIAETYPQVFFAAGGHPLHVHEEASFSVADLVAAASHPKMIGIGETGLDYHYTAQTAALQRAELLTHIEAARQTGLPLIIHARAADDDMARILGEEHRKGAFSCVMHCFSSSPELARAALDLGFYLSMSGIAAFKNSTDLRAIFAAAPLDRILLETDSPYLAPPPHRGKRNEPAYTVHTAEVGAQLFGLGTDDFARTTSENFDRLFAKAAQWTGAA